jgi:hypothetical protein
MGMPVIEHVRETLAALRRVGAAFGDALNERRLQSGADRV